MIAIDTSAMARTLDGLIDRSTEIVREAVDAAVAYLPPVVLTELLSNPGLTTLARAYIRRVPLLPVQPGYWERAGILRGELQRTIRKAGLADCLIAQSCIDNDVPLITYDRDFRHFVVAVGLKLL